VVGYRAMTAVDWLIRHASKALTFVASVCLILMMLQIVLDVVLKYLFNAPIEGNLEIVSRYYMVGVVFLPLAMVEFRHGHINVDLFVQVLPQRLRSYAYALGCLIAFGFFSLLTYQTFLDAVYATRINEMLMGTIYVVIWPARWALPTGFLLIGLAVLLHAYHAVRDPDRFDPTPSQPSVLSSDPS